MNTAEYYRERASACEKIAESAISDEHRQRILEMAQGWRQMADERERILVRGSPDPKPKGPDRLKLR
jgi:hypothetical protein